MASDVATLFETLSLAPLSDGAALSARWRRVDVERMAALVDLEDASVWLGLRAQAHGVELPSALAELARDAQRQAAALRLLISDEVARAVGGLRAAGIDVALIKGCARPHLSPDPLLHARRPLDVDLLVEPGRIEEAVRALREVGYHDAGYDVPAGHWHARAMTAGSMLVELHTSISDAATPEHSWASVARDGRRVAFGAVEAWVPSLAEATWHVALHHRAAVASWRRFRHVADAGALLRLLSDNERPRLAQRLQELGPTETVPVIGWWRSVAAFVEVDLPLGQCEPASALEVGLKWEYHTLRAARLLGGRLHESAADAPYRDRRRAALSSERLTLRRRMLNGLTGLAWQGYAIAQEMSARW